MAKRASQTRDARTTDRTSARRLGTEVNICGKRRRWTAEQKRQIVAEGLEPGMSAAMVARKHGISTGQFYAWRQQLLLLRGALAAGAEAVPNVAGIVATASAPDLEPAIAAPPEPNPPTTAATPVPPVQPDDWIDVPLPDGVATGRLREDFGVLSTLLRPIVGAHPTVAAPHARIAVRPTGSVRACRPVSDRAPYAAFAMATASTAPGGRQFQGRSCSSWCLSSTARRPGVRARRSARRVDRCRSTLLFRSGSLR